MNIATRRMHDAGIRKAAVLVTSLDQLSADLLLDQLGDGQADLVRQAVMELDQIDDEERRRVIDEFRRIGPMVPSASPSGIELTDLPPKQTESPAPPDAPADDDSRPFGFLHEAEDEKLVHLLADERPPTIALVLSHLPPERAANVLDRLAPTLQVEVVRRLVDLENADPETLREIEQVLEARLSRLFDIERRRAAGPQSVARILASCEGLVRRRILENISVEDRPLAERFGRREPNFDEIAQCDDGVLAEVFCTAEPEVVRAALLGTKPAMLERFLRCMAPEEAKRMRRRLARPGPIRLSDVEEARREIAGLAERLSCDELNIAAA